MGSIFFILGILGIKALKIPGLNCNIYTSNTNPIMNSILFILLRPNYTSTFEMWYSAKAQLLLIYWYYFCSMSSTTGNLTSAFHLAVHQDNLIA